MREQGSDHTPCAAIGTFTKAIGVKAARQNKAQTQKMQ